MKTITFKVEEELAQELERLHLREGLARSELVRRALKAYLVERRKETLRRNLARYLVDQEALQAAADAVEGRMPLTEEALCSLEE